MSDTAPGAGQATRNRALRPGVRLRAATAEANYPDRRMKIVIVGGGAGGLELVTKLGRKPGRRKKRMSC